MWSNSWKVGKVSKVRKTVKSASRERREVRKSEQLFLSDFRTLLTFRLPQHGKVRKSGKTGRPEVGAIISF
jgi:hypothetical protein